MARFLDYYRQFEELSPEEVSRELRERRDAARVPVGCPSSTSAARAGTSRRTRR